MIENPIQRQARTKRMIRVLFFVSLSSLLILLALFSCSGMAKHTSKIDLDSVTMVQLQAIDEDDPIAVIHTSEGDIFTVLYPEQAPNAVAGFQALAESGYYNDTYVFRVEQNVFFAAGSKTADGEISGGLDTEAEQITQELNPNLWPIRGALCALENPSTAGWFQRLFGNPPIYNGSRFLIADTIPFTQDTLEELMADNEDNPVACAFRDYGGIPNYSQQMTIFGQTYEGFEVIDAITGAKLTGDDDAQRPEQDIKILSVELGVYRDYPAVTTMTTMRSVTTTTTTTTTASAAS